MEFDQFDWNALANKGQAFFRNGYIQDPKIDISWNVQGDNDRNQEDTLDFRDNFRFDQFLIDEADIKLALISSTDTLRVESEYLTFGLEKFNQFRDPSEHLFYTRNITLDLYQTSVSSTLLEEQVQIDSLVIKTAANQFELVGLTLQKKGKFDIQLDRLTLEALDFKTLRRGNGLMAERLHLEAPQAFYSAMEDNQAPEAASKKPFKLFSSQFPRLDIAQFSIRDGRFDIAQNKIALGDTLHLRDFDLSVGPIKLDSNTTARNYDLSEAYIDLHAGKMYLELNDSLSFVGWDDLSFEDASKKLTLLKPKYGHKYSPEEFTRHIEVQKTWVSTAADSVVIEGIGWEEMIRSSTYQVDLLRVHGLDLYADRDKRVVFDSTQRKELPSISLMALPKEISIDSVEVFNADVTYTQMPEKSGETGTLQITDINARLGNVTNIASKIQDDPKMRFSANGKLTGTGLFTMDVAFDLDQGLGTYSMNGRVGSMDLTRLNNFMEPVALVQIQSGMCKYIEYDFVADTEKAVGKLRFYYKDLRLNILKQNEAQTRYKNRAFLTFFANAFVVQHKNPKFLSAKRKDIFYERDPQRGILDYWSKSILSGVAGSVGALNTKKQLKQFNAQSAQQVSSIE